MTPRDEEQRRAAFELLLIIVAVAWVGGVLFLLVQAGMRQNVQFLDRPPAATVAPEGGTR